MDTGGQAFPFNFNPGMSLHEYYVGIAMGAIINKLPRHLVIADKNDPIYRQTALGAECYAKGMIKLRKQRKEESQINLKKLKKYLPILLVLVFSWFFCGCSTAIPSRENCYTVTFTYDINGDCKDPLLSMIVCDGKMNCIEECIEP